MKTRVSILSGALSLGLLGMLASGCENVSQSEEVAPLSYSANSGESLRIFNGVDNCARSGGNCLPDVIITPPQQQRVRQNLDTEFAAMTGNPAAVKKFFQGSAWKTYFPSLADAKGASSLARLRSGKLDIKRIDHPTKSFYYAGEGTLTPEQNEVVIPVLYE